MILGGLFMFKQSKNSNQHKEVRSTTFIKITTNSQNKESQQENIEKEQKLETQNKTEQN